MKKIVVSTFNNSKNNYGAVFQSHGLYSFLTKLGYDVSYVTVTKRVKAKKNLKTKIKFIAKKIVTLPRKHLINDRIAKFKKFAEETQNQVKFETIDELLKNPPVADVYISGSDQVWNPVHMHEDFFLSYASDEAKKISYAASMGNENIPERNKERFAQFISKYDALSVREDTMIDIISQFTEKLVVQNIDPIFLKTKEEWLEISQPYNKLKFNKFVLVYSIEWEADYNNELKKIAKMTGLPVVSICMGNVKNIYADQVIHNASPREFLYILNKAECVVSTSFHGTAMSVVFNKPFVSFSGKDKPTRIESLMRHLNLNNRNNSDALNESIDFETINKIIAEDRDIAKEYLLKAIEE